MASNKLRTRIVYTSEAVDQMTDAEVRKAYTSIRHIAVERAKRLAKYGYTNTKAGREAARLRDFPKLGEMTDAETRQMLLDTSVWLRNKYSKAAEVSKQNRKAMESFRKMGYEFINKENIVDFLNFMNEMQEAYADKNYDYAKIADAYEIAQKYQIPEEELKRDFESWMNKGGVVETVQKLGEGASSEQISKVLNKAKLKKVRILSSSNAGSDKNWQSKRRKTLGKRKR